MTSVDFLLLIRSEQSNFPRMLDFCKIAMENAANALNVPIYKYHTTSNHKHQDSNFSDASVSEEHRESFLHDQVSPEKNTENHAVEEKTLMAEVYSIFQGMSFFRAMSENENQKKELRKLWDSIDSTMGPAYKRMTEADKEQIRKFDYKGNKYLYRKISQENEAPSPDDKQANFDLPQDSHQESPFFTDVSRSTSSIPTFDHSKNSSLPSKDHIETSFQIPSEITSSASSMKRESFDPVRFTFGSDD